MYDVSNMIKSEKAIQEKKVVVDCFYTPFYERNSKRQLSVNYLNSSTDNFSKYLRNQEIINYVEYSRNLLIGEYYINQTAYSKGEKYIEKALLFNPNDTLLAINYSKCSHNTTFRLYCW